jgi:hypothetical protein
MSAIRPAIVAGNSISEILSTMSSIPEPMEQAIENFKIDVGQQVGDVLRNLKQNKQIVKAGIEVTALLNDLPFPHNAKEQTEKIISTGDVPPDLDKTVHAGLAVTKLLEALKPRVQAGESVTKVLNELSQSGPKLLKKLDDLTPEELQAIGKEKSAVNALKMVLTDEGLKKLKEFDTRHLEMYNDIGIYNRVIDDLVDNTKLSAGASVTMGHYIELRGKKISEFSKPYLEKQEKLKQIVKEYRRTNDARLRTQYADLRDQLDKEVRATYSADLFVRHTPLRLDGTFSMSDEELDKWGTLRISQKDVDMLEKNLQAYDRAERDITNLNKKMADEYSQFYRELDRQYLGIENKSAYNREGQPIHPNIASRGLPQRDVNNEQDNRFQAIVNESVPMMALDHKVLKKILDNGEFQNVFEAPKKAGIAKDLDQADYEAYLKKRIKTEKEKMGIPTNADPANRPVYGFMGNQDVLSYLYNTVDDYGPIVVAFKPEVKDDITVTMDDSVGSGDNDQKASPANAVSHLSLPYDMEINENPADFQDVEVNNSNRSPRYIEWQGGRKLDISDISGVYIPLNIYATLPKTLLAKLNKLGIKINILPPRFDIFW